MREDFGRSVVLDLSSREGEYAALMFPVSDVFNWDSWQDGFDEHWRGEAGEPTRRVFRRVKNEALQKPKSYQKRVSRSSVEDAATSVTGLATGSHRFDIL